MSARHIIGRQTIRLQTDRYRDAHQVQQAVSKAYWQRVAPALERVFDRHAGPDTWIRLDSLEIDLGVIDLTMLDKTEFEALVAEKTEKALLEAIRRLPAQQAGGRPTAVHRFDLWLWWLQHGSLPWYAATPEAGWLDHVLETLGLEQKAVDQLRQLAGRYPEVIRRITLQHDRAFIRSILELHTGTSQAAFMADLQALTAVLEMPGTGFSAGDVRALEIRYLETALRETMLFQREWDWASFIRFLRDDTALLPAVPALKKLFRKKSVAITAAKKLLEAAGIFEESIASDPKTGKPESENPAHTDISTPETIQTDKKQKSKRPAAGDTAPDAQPKDTGGGQQQSMHDAGPAESEKKPAPADRLFGIDAREAGESEPYFIRNAGIILLHTFLPRFFSKLGLLEQQAFKDETSRHRAIVLMHFLATGEPNTPDYSLVLPKFLCSMPVNIPLDHTLSATPEEQEEAALLLSAAIEHWGALGATSPDGLREGFLRRPGKLTHTDTGWQLQVEPNTIDVLLDRLPWNLSLVKMPWMPELLRVEWR